MIRLFYYLLLFCVLFTNFSHIAKATCNYNDFESWKDCFIEEKLSHKLGSIDIEVFQQAKFIQKVIDLDRKQPESKLMFNEYLTLIDIDKKVANGKDFLQTNRETVLLIAKKYRVEPEVIVALLGMESDYGKRQGNFNVIDALATLAFEGRRKSFFEKELINALILAKNETIPYEELKGSWAGAMGQCQFMPSSYLSYAVNHDDDEIKDIWNSVPDALASAANYLIKNGWKQQNIDTDVDTYIKKAAVGDIKDFECSEQKSICKYDDKYHLISLKENGKSYSYYFVSSNFNVLMKWNRSVYFGLATLMIADKLKNQI